MRERGAVVVKRLAALSADPVANTPDRMAGFEAFYTAEYRQVLKLTFVLCGRWAVAEEITQEAFLRALQRWDGQLRNPEAWVRTVAANLARSKARRVQAELRALTRLGRHDDQVEVDLIPSDLAAFWKAVRALPPRQAQAVALYYLEDRSVQNVAQIMGCADGTAKVLLHRARQRLATTLHTDDSDDS